MVNMGSPGIIDLLSVSRPGIFQTCGSWEAMESKVIWAVLHLQTKETRKSCTQSRNFSKMTKFRLWKNVEGHDRGPGKVVEFSKLYR